MSNDTRTIAAEDVLAFRVDPPAFTRGVNGDIVELQDGRLLYAFADAPDGPPGILCCYSDDAGCSWTPPRVLLAPPAPAFSSPDGESIQHPSFLRRRNGQLLMAYMWMVGERDPYTHTYYRFSANEGDTWSEPKVLTPTSELCAHVHNAKLLRLRDGRIIAPTEVRVNVELGDDHRGFVATAWYSDDDGYTWRRSKNEVSLLGSRVEAQEPHVVELNDGRLSMLFRTYSGFVGRAYSDDRGQSWSSGEAIESLPLSKNSSALHVSRIPATGDLLLVRSTGEGGTHPNERPQVYNRRDGHKHPIRTPLTCIISRDEGATWEHERILAGDPYGDFGYPCVLHLPDITLIGYHAFTGLHVARVAPSWFYEPQANGTESLP